jgi:hypothetical protein
MDLFLESMTQNFRPNILLDIFVAVDFFFSRKDFFKNDIQNGSIKILLFNENRFISNSDVNNEALFMDFRIKKC